MQMFGSVSSILYVDVDDAVRERDCNTVRFHGIFICFRLSRLSVNTCRESLIVIYRYIITNLI